MTQKIQLSANQKNLTRRYLIWCYKTAKEELDKVDRYFTQKDADEEILKALKNGADNKSAQGNSAYQEKVKEFELYKDKKFDAALQKKYSDVNNEVLDAEYSYLKNRVEAIEESIVHFFGKTELENIVRLYEEEMTHRILQAREHT